MKLFQFFEVTYLTPRSYKRTARVYAPSKLFCLLAKARYPIVKRYFIDDDMKLKYVRIDPVNSLYD